MPSLIWANGPLKSSPARKALERSKPNLDDGSSSVRLPGSVTIDGLLRTSRQQSPARRHGSSSQASACSLADWPELEISMTYFESDSEDEVLLCGEILEPHGQECALCAPPPIIQRA